MDGKVTLLIDTALWHIHMAIFQGTQCIKEIVQTPKFVTAESAFEVLQTIVCPLQTVDVIGVTVGPGSYTGIRLGIALATGYALGANVPVIPVLNHTLWAQAHSAFLHYPVCIVGDTHRTRDVYITLYSISGKIIVQKALLKNALSSFLQQYPATVITNYENLFQYIPIPYTQVHEINRQVFYTYVHTHRWDNKVIEPVYISTAVMLK